MRLYVSFPGNEKSPGDANDIRAFSGSPYFLLKGLNDNGYAATGLNLSAPPNHRLNRYRWNLKEALLLRGIGGYQYSEPYLDEVWRGELSRLRSGVVINLFQLCDTRLFGMPGLKKVFYIDLTLIQLFENYAAGAHISAYHRTAAIAKEKQQYELADLVVCMCRWAADSVICDYNISEDRVAVVLPGGSIDYKWSMSSDAVRAEDHVRKFDAAHPLRAVFVGKDPWRKGLFRFLDALKTMPAEQERIRLTVIGPEVQAIPAEYRAIPGVEWLGRIGKDREPQRFVEIVRAQDVGILLSTAEATGLSLREFQMLGLAVLVPNVGGSPEMMAPGAGLLVEKAHGPDDIASTIRSLLENPMLVARMKQTAWNARQDMTWGTSAKNLIEQLQRRGIA